MSDFGFVCRVLDKVRTLGLDPDSRQYKNMMKRCMVVCSIYAIVSVVAVVMEVYALMALQFCDGEDLMPLYWSTWTMMQVGSLIAIVGIMLAIFNSLRGSKNPYVLHHPAPCSEVNFALSAKMGPCFGFSLADMCFFPYSPDHGPWPSARPC